MTDGHAIAKTPSPLPSRNGRIPPRTIAKARRLYEGGETSQAEIACRLKISVDSVRRLAARDGWRRSTGRAALVAKVRTRVDAELASVERALGEDGRSADVAERAARTLASLVKTLRELARFDEDEARLAAADAGRGPAGAEEPDAAIADLDGLRRTLAERLERLRREREP